MTPNIAKKPDNSPSSLSSRMTLRLTLPLFVLAAFFAALLLHRQITASNDLNRFQSQLIFQIIQQTFTKDLIRTDEKALYADLGKKIKDISSIYQIRPFDVYDSDSKKMFYESSSLSSWE